MVQHADDKSSASHANPDCNLKRATGKQVGNYLSLRRCQPNVQNKMRDTRLSVRIQTNSALLLEARRVLWMAASRMTDSPWGLGIGTSWSPAWRDRDGLKTNAAEVKTQPGDLKKEDVRQQAIKSQSREYREIFRRWKSTEWSRVVYVYWRI